MTTSLPVEKFVQVNGLRIHYLEWGSPTAPPLILLHGIARVAHCFDHLAPHFAQRFHVIAVDLRGHGESSWHPQGAYLVEDYTSDIEVRVDFPAIREGDIPALVAATVQAMTLGNRGGQVVGKGG